MKRKCKRLKKQILALVLVAAMVLQTGLSPVASTAVEVAESNGTVNVENADVETEVTKESGSNTAQTSSDENLSEETGVELSKKDFSTSFKVTNKWENQFQGEITITNTSDKTIENWNITCKFKYEITEIWNAFVYDYKGDIYQFKNAEWNSDIALDASVSFSFTANWDNDTIAILPDLS